MESEFKSVEFFNGRVSYIFLKGRWCNIIVVNVHRKEEEKLGL